MPTARCLLYKDSEAEWALLTVFHPANCLDGTRFSKDVDGLPRIAHGAGLQRAGAAPHRDWHPPHVPNSLRHRVAHDEPQNDHHRHCHRPVVR